MKIKGILFIILLSLVVIFTIQNSEVVQVKLFFWEFSSSRALVIFIMFALGAICGMFFNRCSRHKKVEKE